MCTDNSKTYTTREVTRLLGVAPCTLMTMIKDGRLDAYKVHNHYRITEESLKRLVLGDKK